jgi:hypothetical protein
MPFTAVSGACDDAPVNFPPLLQLSDYTASHFMREGIKVQLGTM